MICRPLLRLLFFVCGLSVAGGAGADRVVLSPQGGTLSPNGWKTEFLIRPAPRSANSVWLQYSSPVGIELEVQRLTRPYDPKIRHSFNIQYPLLADFGAIPAVSVGVRDLLGTGMENQSLYLVIGRSLGLSERQARFLKEFRLHAGYGTERLGGLFVGVEARFAHDFSLSAEVFQRRPNISIGLPVARNLQAKAYSLDGTVFYGLSFTWVR